MKSFLASIVMVAVSFPAFADSKAAQTAEKGKSETHSAVVPAQAQPAAATTPAQPATTTDSPASAPAASPAVTKAPAHKEHAKKHAVKAAKEAEVKKEVKGN